MSERDRQTQLQAVPFFARFLEGQFCEDVSEEEMNEVIGGIASVESGIVTTLKYPSDNEDGSHGITRKFDFDREGGGSGITKKHPSDSDEAFTNKYPSDGDDRLTIDYLA